MITILIIILVIVCILCLLTMYVWITGKRVDCFRANVKVGDICSIYVGEERIRGNIVAVFDNAVTVEDEEGDINNYMRTDIYLVSNISQR